MLPGTEGSISTVTMLCSDDGGRRSNACRSLWTVGLDIASRNITKAARRQKQALTRPLSLATKQESNGAGIRSSNDSETYEHKQQRTGRNSDGQRFGLADDEGGCGGVQR